MTTFHETIRHILSEVDRFLNDTLRSEKVSRKVQMHKEKIVDLIFKVRQNYPQLLPDKQNPSFQSEDSFIPDVAARDLIDITKAGFLDKKRKKEVRLRGSYQRRYCVIHHNIFYYYSQPTDKKQAGAFHLSGYKFRKAPYLVADYTKQDVSFELSAPGKRSFQFLAESRQEFKEWKAALDKCSEKLSKEEDRATETKGKKKNKPGLDPDQKDDSDYYVEYEDDAVNSQDSENSGYEEPLSKEDNIYYSPPPSPKVKVEKTVSKPPALKPKGSPKSPVKPPVKKQVLKPPVPPKAELNNNGKVQKKEKQGSKENSDSEEEYTDVDNRHVSGGEEYDNCLNFKPAPVRAVNDDIYEPIDESSSPSQDRNNHSSSRPDSDADQYYTDALTVPGDDHTFDSLYEAYDDSFSSNRKK